MGLRHILVDLGRLYSIIIIIKMDRKSRTIYMFPRQYEFNPIDFYLRECLMFLTYSGPTVFQETIH